MECLYFLSLFPLQFAKIRQFQNPFYIEIRLLSFYNDQKNKCGRTDCHPQYGSHSKRRRRETDNSLKTVAEQLEK